MSEQDIGKGIDVVVSLLGAATTFLLQAQKASAIVAAAQAQNRKITSEEWAQLTSADDAARERLDALIKAKSRSRQRAPVSPARRAKPRSAKPRRAKS
jgi:hypothetical protein